MVNKVSDYTEILGKCGYGKEPAETVVRNLAELKEFYGRDELVSIYTYILQNSGDPEILEGVIRLADSNKSPEILSALIDLLLMNRETDSENITTLRVLCAKAVSNYKDASTISAFLYCLNNKKEDYKLRLACADALGRIGNKYAVAPLINVVKDEDEKSVYVKESATFALGLLGDTSAVEPLVEIMESKQGLWDKFSFLKERIIEALGKLNLNSSRVLKVLKQSLSDTSPMVRINAVEALMNSEYEEAYELIKNCLNDEDDEVKKNALTALYNMRGREILDEIIEEKKYPDILKSEALAILEEAEDE